MKKVILFLSIIVIIFLVGCEDKEQVETTNSNNSGNFTSKVITLSDKLQDKDLNIEVYNSMTMENTVVLFDLDYYREYLRVLNTFGTDSYCYTYMIENSEFPLLVVYDGENIHVYEYKNGKASDVTSMNYIDEFDKYSAVSYTVGVFTLMTTIQDYNSVYSKYESIADKDFETYMLDRYSTDKNFGPISLPYDYLDGGELGEEKCTGYIEDGKLKIFVEDAGKNRKTTITINGIEDEIAYLYLGSNDEVSGIPGMTYILTMKGDVYVVSIADVLPDYDEVDVESEEEMTAVKKANIQKATSFVSCYVYPNNITQGEGLETGLYALTYDGTLYRLNQWFDITE